MNIEKLKKELLGKEFELLELDNYIQQEFGAAQSLFDDEYYVIESESVGYYLDKEHYLLINFEIIEKNNNNLYTVIKVNDMFIN